MNNLKFKLKLRNRKLLYDKNAVTIGFKVVNISSIKWNYEKGTLENIDKKGITAT